MKTVVVGVSSGIAAYKTIELVKLLRKENVEVFVVMTSHAEKMVHPKEFEKASSNRVYTQLFEKTFDYRLVLKERRVDHIELADRADVMVITPATANVIAKIAHGMADDFLTTVVLATTAPVIVCPSMNVHMWNNPFVQENVAKLKAIGYHIIEPEEGSLACGYEGKGRLPRVETIRDEALRLLRISASLSGRKVIVTAGGTIEKIDDVRYIANRSSGKMGIAIAEECYLRGADVLLVRAGNAIKPNYSIRERTFDTADELLRIIKTQVKQYDVFYHTAAVSDFHLVHPRKGKISSKETLVLQLRPRLKIVSQIKQLQPKIKLIAFKAEWGLSPKKLTAVAREKCKEWRADAVVVNDVSKSDRGFQSDCNEVFIVLPNGKSKKVSLRPKKDVARMIVDYLVAPQII